MFSFENVYISIRFGLASILKRSSFSSKRSQRWRAKTEILSIYKGKTVCANGKPMEILCNTLSKQGLELVKQTEHIFLPDIPVGMYLSRLAVNFGNFLLVKTLFERISVEEGKRCKKRQRVLEAFDAFLVEQSRRFKNALV